MPRSNHRLRRQTTSKNSPSTQDLPKYFAHHTAFEIQEKEKKRREKYREASLALLTLPRLRELEPCSFSFSQDQAVAQRPITFLALCRLLALLFRTADEFNPVVNQNARRVSLPGHVRDGDQRRDGENPLQRRTRPPSILTPRLVGGDMSLSRPKYGSVSTASGPLVL